ncbi:MAG: hypothetical protein RL748_3286 [Pseudomonadota bacterium]
MITGAVAGTRSHRHAWWWLRYCGLLLCCCFPLLANAIGLGEVRVHSSLGQPLRLTVPLLGGQADSVLQVCVKARLLTLDGTFISALRVTVEQGHTPQLALSSHQNIQEPVVMLALEVACEAHISRDYQVLLDPPEGLNLPATPTRAAAHPANANAPAPAPAHNAGPDPANNPVSAAATTSSASKRNRRTPPAGTTASAPAAGATPTPDNAGLTRRLSRESARRGRNVLKLDSGDASASTNQAANSLAGQGQAGLQLQLSRRLANDNSVVAHAAQEVFSDTVRQQQNQAVLIEVGRVEMKAIQQQIYQMEAELKRLKQAAPVPLANALEVSSPATALQAERQTRHWLLGLGLMLFCCLLAIAWLLWRLLQLRNKQQSFSAGLDLPKAPAPLVASVAAPAPAAAPAKTSLLRKVWQKAGNQSEVAPAAAPEAVTAQATTPTPKPRPAPKAAPASAPRPPRSEPRDEPLEFTRPHFGAAGLPGTVATVPSAPPAASSAPATPAAPDNNDMSFDFALAERLEQEIRAEAEISKQWHSDNEADASADIPAPLLPPLQFRTTMDYATETEIPKVEELNDVMYEAEFWMSLNKIENAIRLLEQYTISDHGTSPLPWLFLFDLYYKTGENEQYISLQRQFQRIFNGRIPDWEDYDQAQQSIGLEAMGSLMARVETLWSTDEVIPFLESLLMDDRDGTREGFELGVYRDILFLCDLAKEVRKSDSLEKLSSVFNLEPME